ncbi:MAG TPA: cupredoxin domain-containing protein, partial [Actinomycetota bacterium]|nr:cupredoxin domain-containing protein [Actinomycetota bacterium]
TAVAASDTGAVVAFGDGDTTKVARKAGGSWKAEAVPGPGGLGVSLALDQDGNPHVAFYSDDGRAFHAHSIGGASWKVDDLGLKGTTSAPNANWGTSIALDDSGVHYIGVADPATGSVQLVTNQGGAFSDTLVPNSVGGADPSIAVSGDGKNLALSFFDTVNANVVVAVPPASGLLLAYSPQSAAPPSAGPVQPTTAGCQPAGTTVEVSAKNVAFDKDCLAAPAGKAFEIVFNNDDTGVPHNLEVFTDSSATTRLAGAKSPADIITGPDTATYKSSPLKAGNYFFHCDIHPNMQGQFVVA